eukprot:TRINITY_DN11861_c0_g1_i3.p1 TRINITY_DN11861_c0_g1~~TRINITY_DN11861_c0_g1_i3.p1  ORF type:complete len:149 (-),score=6.49 TRINITY_DN11861_c0_g1_i3:182-628(-)
MTTIPMLVRSAPRYVLLLWLFCHCRLVPAPMYIGKSDISVLEQGQFKYEVGAEIPDIALPCRCDYLDNSMFQILSAARSAPIRSKTWHGNWINRDLEPKLLHDCGLSRAETHLRCLPAAATVAILCAIRAAESDEMTSNPSLFGFRVH